MSHVTGYPARSRDRSCDRHTVTATRPPPHGHRHTAPATRPPPHGPHHTVTATRSPPHGHRHTATATLGRVTCRVTCRVMCRVMWWVRLSVGTFNHGNLPRALGLRALSAALGPLAPTATPSPLARGHSFLVANTFRQPWPMAAFVSRRSSALGGLQPTAASGPRGTLGHNRLSGRCRH